MSLLIKKEPFRVNTQKLNSSISCSNLKSLSSSKLKSSLNKSLISSNANQTFQLSQSQIHFLNTQSNQMYQISLFIRNVSNHKQVIRLKKPKSSCISVTLNKQGSIAPGLDAKITVAYDSKDNNKIQDSFGIWAPGYDVTIPIHVLPEAGKLRFEPFINFGFIKLGTTKQYKWKIANLSDAMTNINLVASVKGDCKFKIQPRQFTIDAKGNQQVKLTISSNEAGHFDGCIDIQPKLFSVSNVDFVANFCQFNRMISDDEGNALTQIDLGPLFAGEKVEVSTNLVNNTPKVCQFRISRKRGCLTEDQNNLITPQQFGRDDSEKLISFSPSEGILEAYESTPLITKVQAKFEEVDQQFFCNYILGRVINLPQQKQWSYTVKAHINSQQNPLPLFLKGTSMIPKLHLSQNFFDFGQVSVNSRKQKILRIQNYSPKTITLNFKNKSANYIFSQKKLMIQAKGSASIIVTFCPKIVGDCNQVLPMSTGEFSFPIKALGKGVFKVNQHKNLLDSSRFQQSNAIKGEQIKIDQMMDKTILQNQVSYINDRRRQNSIYVDDMNKSSIHFQQSYITNNNQSLISNSIYLTQHKKPKALRDRSGKQVKISASYLSLNQQIQPYPSTSKNSQQQRLITKQLSASQLTLIQVSPVIIDIGKIYLRSLIRKTFHVCNFNSKPISIELNTYGLECFSQSRDGRQVLPPNSWGGLQIRFEALKEGQFKHNLQYLINGKHFFQMMVVGTVIQPTLTVSKHEVKFFATEDDKTFQKKQTLILTNPYEYQVQFNFKTQQNSLFRVEPQSGSVVANGQKTVYIYHKFDSVTQYGIKIEQSLRLRITHGKTIELKCMSMVPQSFCISKSQQINFKEVAIGKIYENKIILKNTSKNFTIFKILIPKDLQNIITVSTLNGSLHAQQMQQINFKIQAFSSINIDSNISFLIRGGKTLNIPLRANVITPKIKVQNMKIDFGSTPIEGNPASKVITLLNQSQIAVDLEFRLPYDSYLSSSLKVSKILDENTQLISSQSKQKTYKGILIRVNPKSKSSITLEFTPQEVNNYQFLLPLFIYNSSQTIVDLQKPCICKGIKNRLMATQKQINFDKIIIEQNLESYQKNKTLQIKNPQEQPIEWWVDDSNIYPFSLQRSKGKLQGFEKMNLKVFFYSDTQGDYSRQLQFFIDQNESQQSSTRQQYLKVSIKASASYPTLYFSQPYIILPLCNLNQQSKTSFQIINGGYQNINIKHMISQQFQSVDLKLNFVQGTNLGVTKKKIKVQVAFQTQKPISFTVRIDFYDNNNRMFSIMVSGTADNSKYTIIHQHETQIDKDCSFVRNFINSIGCLDDSLYEFPRSIIENQFEKFGQFLANYSTSFEKVKSVVKKSPKFFFSFDYLSEIIKSIKSEGGFLNQIRPELLLPYNQYLQAIRLRAEGNLNILSNYCIIPENRFQMQQKRSWLVLVYQIFKVYSRVAVGKTKNSQFWAKFTAREKVIINWLEQAYLSEAKIQYPKKENILQQLNDSQLLSAVISKYTNIKILEIYGRQIKAGKQKQRRVKNIIDTFNQIGINCHCRVEDLMRSNPKQMLLIVQGLFMILPSYLQKGDSVLFSCALGQTLTKSIEISNPSKNPITYIAKVEGCRAYTIQNQTQFIIDSKSSHEVKIKYISNININNVNATLTLTGKASAKFTPSTFIFVLKSQNLGRISEKNVQVTGQLYEQYEFGFGVQNNFDTDGDFKIEVISANENKDTPIAFYFVNPSIKIKKGETVNCNMLFIPLIMQTQKCLVIFRDTKVGLQFQYQITGIVQAPQLGTQILRIPQTCITNKKYSISLSIPQKNQNLLKAKKQIQSIIQHQQKKFNIINKTQQNLSNDKLFPKINYAEPFSVKINPISQMILLRTDSILIRENQLFSIANSMGEQEQNQLRKDQPKIALQVNMKVAVKEASFVLILRNPQGTDVRRYKVLISSVYKPLKYELEMKTPINKLLTQKLPLVNLNNDTNSYFLTLTTNDLSKGVISLDRQKQVIVQGKTTQMISVLFKPKSQITYNASIRMQNVTTGQIIEYEIICLGEDPQAETLVFDQEIRKEKVHQIKLPIERSTKCSVTKFAIQQELLTYEKNFIANASNQFFKFKFAPKIPGLYEGKLIIEEEGKVYAYKISVNARDVIEDQIKIKTIERKNFIGQIADIPFGQYTVQSKNPCLKFNKKFISAESTNKGVFMFEFYSTKPQEIQSNLTFLNDKTGQLTYLLKIKVDQMPEIKFQPFKTQLGTRHEESIKFQNNESEPLKISGNCSHPTNFYFEPNQLIVPPHSEIIAKLIYQPSKLELEQGKVHFTSERGEKWNYHMCGYGLLQSRPIRIEMKGIVGKEKIQSITFVNPLQRRVQAYISLDNQDEQNAFELILKSSKFQLDYQQELILPILLKPKSVAVNKCMLTVTLSEKFTFKYELIGINEFIYTEERHFRLPARTKKQETITFDLPLLNITGILQNQKPKLKIICMNENMKPLIKQSIKVLNKQKPIIDGKVSFDLILKAFKPFKAQTQFMIILSNGCRWIQKFDVIFTAPTVDDKLQIIADINKPSSSRFKLTNRLKQHAKFKAYFTGNNCNEFSVTPKFGELEPFGRDGTPFEITFAPTMYRKEWQGKMIIQTEQSYWSYDVKGLLPPYLPPISKGTARK